MAVDYAAAFQRDVVDVIGVYEVMSDVVGAEFVRDFAGGRFDGAGLVHLEVFDVGAAEQDGARVDPQRDVALEEDGPREKFAVIENDRSAAGRVTRVDGFLDRGSVERLAVPSRAVLGNVADRGVS